MRQATGQIGRALGLLLLAVALAGAQDVDEQQYQVDAGDILEILVPRYPEFSKPYAVSQDGAIAVDLAGEVEVRGLTPPEIEARLITRLGEYLRYPEGIRVRVTARRMRVRVLGQVGQPGLKEVPKGANAQEILAAAGGPEVGAVLTRIVVRRQHGDWLEEIPVDLKAYLEGRGGLPEVINGDTIFVPRTETDGALLRPLTPDEVLQPGSTGSASVYGAVLQPGEVTLRDDNSLLAVLTAAGGWAPTADLSRIRRVRGGEGPAEVLNLQAWLDQGGVLPKIEPGDVVTVPSRTSATRTVRVLGAVATPGPVPLPADADLQSALAAAGGALPIGDVRQIRVIREVDGDLVGENFDYQAYLRDGDVAALPTLGDGDVVFVPQGAIPRDDGIATAYVFGEVAKPGAYPLTELRPLLHLLAQAGGLTAQANRRRILITRAEPGDGPPQVAVDLEAFQAGEIRELPVLAAGDTVTVEPNRLTVLGDVATPGPVVVGSRGTVIEAIAAAGGPNATANLRQVVLTRQGDDGPRREVIDLEQYLYDPEHAPPLAEVRAGDVIAVAAGPRDATVAYVLGAVKEPGLVEVPGREVSVLYALAEAGGVLPTADREQIRILKSSATGELQIFNLKAYTNGEASANAVPLRIQPGDVVMVDELLGRPGRGVLVLGAVANQGRVLVEDGQSVIDTIGLAGGLTADANPSQARLVHPNGEAEHLDLSQFSKHGRPTPTVKDGDVLIVAHRREAPGIWDELLRILPILGIFFNL